MRMILGGGQQKVTEKSVKEIEEKQEESEREEQ